VFSVFFINDAEEGAVGADLGCGGGNTYILHVCIHIRVFKQYCFTISWVLTLDVEEEILPACMYVYTYIQAVLLYNIYMIYKRQVFKPSSK
jgi:hypothetical protein